MERLSSDQSSGESLRDIPAQEIHVACKRAKCLQQLLSTSPRIAITTCEYINSNIIELRVAMVSRMGLGQQEKAGNASLTFKFM